VSMGNDFNSRTCSEWAGLGATYPLIDDRSTEIWRSFGNGAVPRNVLIDSDGKLHYSSIGFNESAITTILDTLLSTQSVDPTNMPSSARLVSSYPNPFNAGLQLEFELDHAQTINIDIHDSQGRPVRTLFSGNRSGGTHRLSWTGEDNQGEQLSSGVYLILLKTPEALDSRKILYLK